MLGGHVLLLADVLGQVIELDLGLTFEQVLAHALPVAEADGLLTAVRRELPVEKLVLLLFALAQQRRQDAQAVDVLRRCSAAKSAQRWQHVIKGAGEIAGSAGLDLAGPAGQERDADAAFVEAALE